MPTMFEILEAQIKKDHPTRDRVGFWPITDSSQRHISNEPLIYTVSPAQFMAAWLVTALYPKKNGGVGTVHSIPELSGPHWESEIRIATALIQLDEVRRLYDESELFRQREDELKQLKAIADPNTAATLGSIYMGIARDRADIGLPTHMQLNYTPDGILTVNGKWSSKRPEEAITSWGLENASEIRRMGRTSARKRNRGNLKET